MSRVVPPSGERVEATKRRAMTKARRQRIYDAAHGLCGICGYAVALDECDIEHPIAVDHGGSDEDSALVPVHRACHRPKTGADIRISAKIKRIHARQDGTRRPRKAIQTRGFPKGSRTMPSRPFPK